MTRISIKKIGKFFELRNQQGQSVAGNFRSRKTAERGRRRFKKGQPVFDRFFTKKGRRFILKRKIK